MACKVFGIKEGDVGKVRGGLDTISTKGWLDPYSLVETVPTGDEALAFGPGGR